MTLVCRKKPCPAGWDDAVSPVVGVMLMLVVTIIIAAIVSSFASGMGGSREKAPVTSLKFNILAGEPNNNPSTVIGVTTHVPQFVQMENIGGETLYTRDLQIVTTYTVPETYGSKTLEHRGKVIKHTIDGSLTPGGTNAWDKDADPFIPQVNNEAAEVIMGPGSTQEKKFGEIHLRPGGILYRLERNAFLGFDVMDRETFGFKEGSVVHITVIHKPSGKFIYDKDVVVRW